MIPNLHDKNYKKDGDDYRHWIEVFLIRDGRPKYWDFHCVYCGNKICELDGNIIHLRDVSNDGVSAPPLRAKCIGRPPKYCRMWYSFTLSN